MIPWTPEEEDLIEELYLEGKTDYQIFKEFRNLSGRRNRIYSRTEGAIRGRRKKIGLRGHKRQKNIPNTRWGKKELIEMVSLRNKGLEVPEISVLLERSESAIYHQLSALKEEEEELNA